MVARVIPDTGKNRFMISINAGGTSTNRTLVIGDAAFRAAHATGRHAFN
jgi:hypothetical protein